MRVRRYLAFDIGCIECGESSAVIGTFATREEAETAATAAAKKQAEIWHGQHKFQVHDLSRPAPGPDATAVAVGASPDPPAGSGDAAPWKPLSF